MNCRWVTYDPRPPITTTKRTVLRICLIATCAGASGLLLGSSLTKLISRDHAPAAVIAMHSAPKASVIKAAQLHALRSEHTVRADATTQARVQRATRGPDGA